MLIGQTHFVPMDFEPGWRLRLFLSREVTVRFQRGTKRMPTFGYQSYLMK